MIARWASIGGIRCGGGESARRSIQLVQRLPGLRAANATPLSPLSCSCQEESEANAAIDQPGKARRSRQQETIG
jgi:hypothetical protein